MKKNLNSLDVLRFVCAMCVVGIHVPPFEAWPLIDMAFSLVTRNAVPIFFYLTAYFFFIKERSLKDLWNYVRDKLAMYLFWVIVYLVVTGFLLGIAVPTGGELLRMIFTSGGYDVMWFLLSLILGMPIIYFLRKRLQTKYIVLITAGAYVVAVCMTSYYPLFRNIPFVPEMKQWVDAVFGLPTGLLYGLLFLALGMKAAENTAMEESDWKRACLRVGLSFLMLGIECTVGVVVLKTQQTVLWLSMIWCTTSIVHLVKQIRLKDRPVYLMMRKLCVAIYVVHKPVHYLLKAEVQGMWRFLTVMGLTVLVSYALITWKGNRKWVVF